MPTLRKVCMSIRQFDKDSVIAAAVIDLLYIGLGLAALIVVISAFAGVLLFVMAYPCETLGVFFLVSFFGAIGTTK